MNYVAKIRDWIWSLYVGNWGTPRRFTCTPRPKVVGVHFRSRLLRRGEVLLCWKVRGSVSDHVVIDIYRSFTDS